MNKQVLFLDVPEDGWMTSVPATPEGSDDEAAPRNMSKISLGTSSDDVPLKNTFIHFHIDKSPCGRPATPTNSAPGALLSRLFKTRPAASAMESEHTADVGVRIHEPKPVGMLSCNWIPSTQLKFATIATQTDDLDDSEGSTTGSSFKGSPVDFGTASTNSTANFSIDGRSALVEMHRHGQCKPCNYFWYKEDGCRQGANCTFCHLCPKGEIKKRKKDKIRQLRTAGVLRR